MLRLSKITKDYSVGDSTVNALKGISISFRENEFVSVLGPSGCGKTTLLNIVGGLDRYSEGDLYINGRSTREFKDRDWDVYRNHRIGFIFQSYNLIPHQTVLGNVELALTIAGIGKAERTERAKAALDKVGLEGQYNKKPNQLSGGQCQRVAIARALVNDPDILLADEPTGALDTVTSVQIMELIREIANEKLVIMVTHNPELAEKYSTRIIRLLDGELTDDTMPFSKDDEIKEVNEKKENLKLEKATEKKKKSKNKAKMSFWTSFRLSLNNLLSKRARTIMTSIAGSIGIIGVSLVLSISYGVQAFINDMQNDMLSGNPVMIQSTGMDISSLMQMTGRKDQAEALKEFGYVNVDSMIEFLASRAGAADDLMMENNITKEYIDYVLSMPDGYAASIFLDYGLDVTNNIYIDFKETADSKSQEISLSVLRTIYTSTLEKSPYSDYASYVTSLTDVLKQAPDSEDYILSQYNVLEGKLATGKNEIMIVLDNDSMLTDLVLAQLGYYTQEEFLNLVFRSSPEDDGSPNIYYDPELDKDRFSYEELLGKTFVWYSNDELFTATGNQYTPFTYIGYNDGTLEDGLELKVVGILEPKEDISYGCLTSGVYYTEALTKHIIEGNIDSEIINALISSGQVSVSSGMQTVTLPDGTVTKTPIGITFKYSYSYLDERYEDATGFLGTNSAFMSLAGGMFGGNEQMEELSKMKTLTLQQLGGSDLASSISVYPVDFEQKQFVLDYLDEWNSQEEITFFSESQNGSITLAADERDDIKYTDNLSLVIAIINNLISIITFALIGFTSLSLLVSCVMIGIITYVSVVERIKEIGVIRSLGGRKKDVSLLFTAETFIIGLVSGLIGIGITYLGSWVINKVIFSIQGISAIAIFPWYYAVTMVCVSVLLTLVSGVLPSRSAAKKDPVVALRTE